MENNIYLNKTTIRETNPDSVVLVLYNPVKAQCNLLFQFRNKSPLENSEKNLSP